MTTLVIEHLKASELPTHWAKRLHADPEQRVTVRIETESVLAVPPDAETFVTDDPAFGIWRDRDNVADVSAFARELRGARYLRDGSRLER